MKKLTKKKMMIAILLIAYLIFNILVPSLAPIKVRVINFGFFLAIAGLWLFYDEPKQ